MAESGKGSAKKGGWVNEFQKEADPMVRAQFAEQVFDLALVNAPDTPELRLLRNAPFLIVGCFNARDVPITTETLRRSVERFADTVTIPASLEQQVFGRALDDKYQNIEGGTQSEISDPDTLAENDLNFRRMMAKIQKTMAISQKVDDALAPTIRQELGLDAQTSADDTYMALSNTVTRGFAQLLEAVQPGSTTNPEHSVWQIDFVVPFVGVYRDMLQAAVIKESRGLGMRVLAKPADPSPMG